MRYTYHVFTPLARFQNLLYVTKRLSRFGVQWHPILDADVPFTLSADWIHPMVCPTKEPGWFMGHWYQNYWVEHADIVGSDRYIMCSDDDDYEVGFFDKMDAHDGDILICSMNRAGFGDFLAASPANLAPARIGGEQVMVAGSILKQCRWGHHYAGDWDWIAQVLAHGSPTFVPEAIVWWNALDTSRPRDYNGQ